MSAEDEPGSMRYPSSMDPPAGMVAFHVSGVRVYWGELLPTTSLAFHRLEIFPAESNCTFQLLTGTVAVFFKTIRI